MPPQRAKGGLNTSAMGVLLRTDTTSKAVSHLSKDMGNDKLSITGIHSDISHH